MIHCRSPRSYSTVQLPWLTCSRRPAGLYGTGLHPGVVKKCDDPKQSRSDVSFLFHSAVVLHEQASCRTVLHLRG